MKRFKLAFESKTNSASVPELFVEDFKDKVDFLNKGLENLCLAIGLQGKLMLAKESNKDAVADVCILSLEHIVISTTDTLKISTEGFKEKFQAIIQWIKDIARKVWEAIRNFFSKIRDFIGRIFFGTDKIKSELEEAEQKLKSALHDKKLFKDAYDYALSAGEQDVSNLRQKLSSARKENHDLLRENSKLKIDNDALYREKLAAQTSETSLQKYKSDYNKLIHKLRTISLDIFLKSLNFSHYKADVSIGQLDILLREIISFHTRRSNLDLLMQSQDLDTSVENIEDLLKRTNSVKDEQILDLMEDVDRFVEKINKSLALAEDKKAELEKSIQSSPFLKTNVGSPINVSLNDGIRFSLNSEGAGAGKYKDYLKLLQTIEERVNKSTNHEELLQFFDQDYNYINFFFGSNHTREIIQWVQSDYSKTMKEYDKQVSSFVKSINVEENIKFLEQRMKFFEDIQKTMQNDDNASSVVKQAINKLIDVLKLNLRVLTKISKTSKDLITSTADVVKLVNDCLMAHTAISNICSATLSGENKLLEDYKNILQ